MTTYGIKNEPKKRFKNEWSEFKEDNTRKTYDIYLNGQKHLNFETKEDAESWLENAREKNFMGIRNGKVEIKTRKSQLYKLGEMWRDDFDYTGMVKAGSRVNSEDSTEKLSKLFDSYEDVNYHEASAPLYEAVELRKAGKVEEANKKLEEFRIKQDKLLEEWGEK